MIIILILFLKIINKWKIVIIEKKIPKTLPKINIIIIKI